MAQPDFDFRKAPLGDILVHVGLVTPEQLREALRECDPDQKNLAQVLVALGFATEDRILKAVSLRLGIPYFTSFEGLLDPEAAKLLPEAAARRHLAVPVFREEDSLTVGMVNPADIQAIDAISSETGLHVSPVMTTLANLFNSIRQAYAPVAREESPADPAAALAAAKAEVRKFQAEESNVVETVNSLFHEAMARKASDLHLEPAESCLRSRYRVDGMLLDGNSFNKEMEPAIIARIKILAKLDITETRLPQDGHIRFEYGGRSVDLRVSTLPTIHGEKTVLRVLDSSTALKRVGELGMHEATLKGFVSAIHRPHGIILVTGPTGSGKTTTLYSALMELNDSKRNVVTLEDPVEYRIDRINQVETHASIGLTFAAGLRSILRQDPNIVLVGEIRDQETAEIAMQAALTGHLVLSTLHTNDSPSAVHRLLNMRVEPFLVAAAAAGVMSQRLVRRLCDRCKRAARLSPHELEVLGPARESIPADGTFFEPVGCDTCFGTGYAGRFAIFEWLEVTGAMRELILGRASLDDIRAQARAAGMVPMLHDALHRAALGTTSIAEVLRVAREERSA